MLEVDLETERFEEFILQKTNGNELLGELKDEPFYKNFISRLYSEDQRNAKYNLLLTRKGCEIHLSFENQTQDFRWKYYAKPQSNGWLRRDPVGERELFRGKRLETHYHEENQLAFKCRKKKNIQRTLKLLKALRAIVPVSINTVILSNQVFSKSHINSAMKMADKLIRAIGQCSNLIIDEFDEMTLLLLRSIKVTNYLEVRRSSSMLFAYSKLFAIPSFHARLVRRYTVADLLDGCGKYGTYTANEFTISIANSLIRCWLSSPYKTIGMVQVSIDEENCDNFEKLLDGLVQYGHPSADYSFQLKTTEEKIEFLISTGVELYRFDGTVGTVMIRRSAKKDDTYNFILHARYPRKRVLTNQEEIIDDSSYAMDLANLENIRNELKVFEFKKENAESDEVRLAHSMSKIPISCELDRCTVEVERLSVMMHIKSSLEARQKYGYFAIP